MRLLQTLEQEIQEAEKAIAAASAKKAESESLAKKLNSLNDTTELIDQVEIAYENSKKLRQTIQQKGHDDEVKDLLLTIFNWVFTPTQISATENHSSSEPPDSKLNQTLEVQSHNHHIRFLTEANFSQSTVTELIQKSEAASSELIQESEADSSELIQKSEAASSELIQKSEADSSELIQKSEADSSEQDSKQLYQSSEKFLIRTTEDVEKAIAALDCKIEESKSDQELIEKSNIQVEQLNQVLSCIPDQVLHSTAKEYKYSLGVGVKPEEEDELDQQKETSSELLEITFHPLIHPDDLEDNIEEIISVIQKIISNKEATFDIFVNTQQIQENSKFKYASYEPLQKILEAAVDKGFIESSWMNWDANQFPYIFKIKGDYNTINLIPARRKLNIIKLICDTLMESNEKLTTNRLFNNQGKLQKPGLNWLESYLITLPNSNQVWPEIRVWNETTVSEVYLKDFFPIISKEIERRKRLKNL